MSFTTSATSDKSSGKKDSFRKQFANFHEVSDFCLFWCAQTPVEQWNTFKSTRNIKFQRSPMPLPYLKNQCSAKSKRSQARCLNPCAFNCKVCRFHGARRKAPSGPDHPLYIHGQATKEARAEHSKKMTEIRELEAIGFKIGMFTGTRFVGRKPKDKS